MPHLLDYLKVLSDPTRLKLLRMLSGRVICVCDLVDLLGLSQPAVSNQLSKLRKLGLVKVARRGQWNYYTMDGEGLRRFLDEWHRFWDEPPGQSDIDALGKNWKALVERLDAGEADPGHCLGARGGRSKGWKDPSS